MDLYELAIRFKSEGFKAVSRDMDSLDKKGQGISKAFAALKATLVVGAVGSFIRKIAVESIEAQKQTAQLNAVLKSTGGIAGLTAGEIDEMAGALQRTTTFSDDAVKSAASLLLTFTNIRGEIFKQTLPAITDMATALGTDLNSAALQVGKALQNPIKGVTALQRAGVSFSEAQKGVIKNLVETNRLAEAQGIILKELSTQFGGSAAAARNTLGGALEGLKNSFNELFEMTGDETSGLIGAINDLSRTIDENKEKWQRWAGELLDESGGPLAFLNKIIEKQNKIGEFVWGSKGGSAATGARGGGGGGGRDTPTGPLTFAPAVVMAQKPTALGGGGTGGGGGKTKLPGGFDLQFEGLREPFEAQEFSGPAPKWMTDAFAGPWGVDAQNAVKEANKAIAEGVIAEAKATAQSMQEQLASIFAGGIVNGLIQGFQDGGIAGAFKSLTQSLLAGFGQMFAAIAVKAIAASKLMATLTKFFIAHPLLALGAGVALLALARGMGGGTGGGGGGGYAGGGYTSGIGRGTEDATRYKFVNRDGCVNSLKPAQPLTFNVFGNTPEVQRFIGETSAAYERRKG